MGEVRAAFDDRLQRDVAIKFLRADLAAQPSIRARFESEARNAAQLCHPNVVTVFDTGEREGQPFLVMERLPGRSLHDAIAEGSMSTDQVRLLALDVLAGLGAAHDLGILHRDITPSNILLTDEGVAKIADFGIAKSLDEAAQTTMVGTVLGTPAFMAPERLRGEPATVASDLYSVGVVLNRALGDASASPALRSAIDAATDPDPAQRPASANDMRALLTSDEEVAPPTTVLFNAAPLAVERTNRLERVRTIPRDAWIAAAIVAAGGGLLLAVTNGDRSPSVAGATTAPSTTTTAVQVTTPPTTAPRLNVVNVQPGPVGHGKGKGHGKHDD